MVKNVTGGSKHKSMARKGVSARGGSKLRKITEEGEIYAVVVKLLGGARCLVMGMDNQERDCVIRGKFRGSKKRDNTLRGGVLVLVGDREWSTVATSVKKPVCDLLEVYSDIDRERLKTSETSIDWKFITNLDNSGAAGVIETEDITFCDDNINEEYQRQIEDELNSAGDMVTMDFEDDTKVDIEDI